MLESCKWLIALRWPYRLKTLLNAEHFACNEIRTFEFFLLRLRRRRSSWHGNWHGARPGGPLNSRRLPGFTGLVDTL